MRSASPPSCGPRTAGAPELIEVEVIGARRPAVAIGAEEVRQLIGLAFAAGGLSEGHVAVEFVDAERMRALNREHRRRDAATDVLSFPVDEAGEAAGPRELGDIVICPDHAGDLAEAVVHGVLHLAGMDHEQDQGEMLALQREILRWVTG